jgi:D-alanyl-D-alanine carboxypeptidase
MIAGGFAIGLSALQLARHTNYAILGLIVKAVTGSTIEAETRSRIFKPLHLAATTYPVAETTIEGKHAHGYFLFGAPPLVDVTEFSPSVSTAGGAIVSTVADVDRFSTGRSSRGDCFRRTCSRR